MRILLTKRNQITIPKQIIDDMNIDLCKYYDMIIEDNKLIIDLKNAYESISDIDELNQKQEPKSEPKSEPKPESIIKNNTYESNKTNNSKIKIESNIDQIDKYKDRVKYSDCRLVIRTKRKYINNFCEECRGQLLEGKDITNINCPYKNSLKNENISKATDCQESNIILNRSMIERKKSKDENIKTIQSNIDKLQNRLNDKLKNNRDNDLQSKPKIKYRMSDKQFRLKGQNTIEYVESLDDMECDKCRIILFKWIYDR